MGKLQGALTDRASDPEIQARGICLPGLCAEDPVPFNSLFVIRGGKIKVKAFRHLII